MTFQALHRQKLTSFTFLLCRTFLGSLWLTTPFDHTLIRLFLLHLNLDVVLIHFTVIQFLHQKQVCHHRDLVSKSTWSSRLLGKTIAKVSLD